MSDPSRPHTFAHLPETLQLGDRRVRRLGYGAMRLPGPEVWGPPADPAGALRVVRRAVDLGVQFIDTSWFYGPHVANPILAEALHPYPDDLVIATNIFVYYNFFEQALAMQNISHMMNPGGIFIVNQVLSNQHPDSLKLIDQTYVSFNAKGLFGDNVVAYQQQ